MRALPWRLSVRIPACAPGERDGGMTRRVQGHREECGSNDLAGREEEVELARARVLGHLAGERDEFVGGVTHRGDDDDKLVARFRALDDAPGDDVSDAFGAADGGAAVLLDNERHGNEQPVMSDGFCIQFRRVRRRTRWGW